jgi:hypothetical protein
MNMARQVIDTEASEVGEEVDIAQDAPLPAIPDGDIDGLEDLDDTDITIPRIVIDHPGGVFKDSQTNETFDSFECIVLGLVKQRALWPPTPEEGEGPLCRAVDYETGFPDPAKWVVKHNGVSAQKQSGFTFAEVEEGKLPCANCGLKEWESHPNNNTPWCSEQFTFPVVRVMDDGSYAPALVTFQKTGLKPAKSYLSGFKTSKRPLYTAITRIDAIHTKKGTVEYVVPSFTKIGESDPSEWPSYSKSLHNIREFITTPRVFEEAETTATVQETEEEEVEETIEEPAAPAPKAAAPKEPVVEEDDDDEEPF